MRGPPRRMKPRVPVEVQRLASEQSVEALRRLVRMMKNGRTETVKLAAALAVLRQAERGPGGQDDVSLIKFFSAIPGEPDPDPRGDV